MRTLSCHEVPLYEGRKNISCGLSSSNDYDEIFLRLGRKSTLLEQWLFPLRTRERENDILALAIST